MGEIICNHVAWRAQQDLQHKADRSSDDDRRKGYDADHF